MSEEKKVNSHRELFKCASVVIAFYLIVYVLFAHYAGYGFLNPWLIGIVLILTVIDIKSLRWMMNHFEEDDGDDYP